MTTLNGMIARPDGSLWRANLVRRNRFRARARVRAATLILPGFIDLQVNGSHGIDVMNASADEIVALGRHLAREGTTAWLPTAITAPIEIERVDGAIAKRWNSRQSQHRFGRDSGHASRRAVHFAASVLARIRRSTSNRAATRLPRSRDAGAAA